MCAGCASWKWQPPLWSEAGPGSKLALFPPRVCTLMGNIRLSLSGEQHQSTGPGAIAQRGLGSARGWSQHTSQSVTGTRPVRVKPFCSGHGGLEQMKWLRKARSGVSCLCCRQLRSTATRRRRPVLGHKAASVYGYSSRSQTRSAGRLCRVLPGRSVTSAQ